MQNLIINDVGSAAVLKLEVTEDDLMKTMENVIREKGNSILAKLTEDSVPKFVAKKEAMEMLDAKCPPAGGRCEEESCPSPQRVNGRIFYRKDELNEAYERVSRNYGCEFKKWRN